MINYSHSGSLGDLIYSLPLVKASGGGNFNVNLRSVHKVSAEYGYNVDIIPEYHQQMISDDTYSALKPLLEMQPYINSVTCGEYEDDHADVKLDQFRGVLWRSFTGNYVESYFKTFQQPYTAETLITPWLTAPTNRIAKYVITRTDRYRDTSAEATAKWQQVLEEANGDIMFVGLFDEWSAFCGEMGKEIPLYMNADLLEVAAAINGADHVVTNQTFAYSLAVGLGRTTTLETWKRLPLEQNECYFNRPNSFYF